MKADKDGKSREIQVQRWSTIMQCQIYVFFFSIMVSQAL